MIDHTDLKIMNELRKKGRITMKELGEKVHLTGQATANRVTKLEELGVIKNYTINIDWFKAGKSIQTFLTIYTKSLAHKPFLSFIQQQQYIENIYKISGDGCYLIEGFFSSHLELDAFLEELNTYSNYKISIVINKLKTSN